MGDSAQDEGSVLQSGTFCADFLQLVLLDIPPNLSGARVGFGFGFEQDSIGIRGHCSLGGRMTGACRLIRRLSSPAQGAISSVLSPPICLRHDLSDGASSVRENEGRGGGNRRHMVKISCIR